MGRFSKGSLRLLLILLVALAILPLFGLALFSNLQQRQVSRAEANQEALRLARIAVLYQEEKISGAQQLLATLARLPIIRDGNAAECEHFLEEYVSTIP